MRIPKGTNRVPIPLTFLLASAPSEGVTLADVVLQFHDGQGAVQEMSQDAPVELAEIGEEFPGEYLLKSYPLEMTDEEGLVRVKWEAVADVCDAGSASFEVDDLASKVRDLWLASLGRSEFAADQSAQLVYDEDDELYLKVPLRNKDGGNVVITGNGPVSRNAAEVQ